MSSHSSLAPCRSASSEPVTLPDTDGGANPDVRKPLLITCPDCEDGTVWRSRHGGNDPDVWAVRCEECDGTGIETLHCDGCRNEATEMFDGAPWCAAHAAEQRADAIDAKLDTIEVLLDWCREHVRPPPADLLYDAVGALQSLRSAA